MYTTICKRSIALNCVGGVRACANKASDIQIPPEPTTCCMSGCANCVWIDYATELAKTLKGNTEQSRAIVLEKIADPNLKMFLSMELRNLQIPKEESESTKS